MFLVAPHSRVVVLLFFNEQPPVFSPLKKCWDAAGVHNSRHAHPPVQYLFLLVTKTLQCDCPQDDGPGLASPRKLRPSHHSYLETNAPAWCNLTCRPLTSLTLQCPLEHPHPLCCLFYSIHFLLLILIPMCLLVPSS